MKISFLKYHLHYLGKSSMKPREGALLRILQKDGILGYADCHPWIDLGDASLEMQLALLAKGKATPLTKQSLMFSRLDGQARARQTNLFSGMQIPENHYHISDQSLLSKNLLSQLSKQGFRLVKVKLGQNFQADCQMLKTLSKALRENNLKLRLDFNCRLNRQQFLDFLNQCNHCLDLIDYFEDPFPYEPVSWQAIRETAGIKVACDKDSILAIDYPNSCDFLVIKPAIQEASMFTSRKPDERRLVLTSYLDHPLGQLSGLYIAATILQENPHSISECGFLTHHAYESTEFSRAFTHQGTQLVPSLDGFGWGYDRLLNQLTWTEL
jgi:O-succinylbenzoate synthase